MSNVKSYDLLILVSGGIRGECQVPPWVQTRIDKVIELQNQTKYILCTSAFTPYKALPLNTKGEPLYDSTVAANILLKHAVPKEKIILDNYSKDTLGNATFARIMLAEFLNLKNIAIITSEFHMPRTKEIFTKLFSIPNTTQSTTPTFNLTFITTEDKGMPAEQKKARTKKEIMAIQRFKSMHGEKQTVQEFQQYMLLEHGAYVPKGTIWEQDKDTQESY